jgi:hypothetical protein
MDQIVSNSFKGGDGRVTLSKVLLFSGVLSSIYYVVINVLVPMQFEGYNYASQTVSEISAIGAPTRRLWVVAAVGYVVLLGSFGWGVWISSEGKRNLRIFGGLIIAYCVINIYWPPMHLRGSEKTLTDVLHIVWAGVTVLLMIIMMGFGASALGKLFRTYTIFSVLLLMSFGFLTGRDAPNLEQNLPTPWMGVYERLAIGVFMAWIIVISMVLLRRSNKLSQKT